MAHNVAKKDTPVQRKYKTENAKTNKNANDAKTLTARTPIYTATRLDEGDPGSSFTAMSSSALRLSPPNRPGLPNAPGLRVSGDLDNRSGVNDRLRAALLVTPISSLRRDASDVA